MKMWRGIILGISFIFLFFVRGICENGQREGVDLKTEVRAHLRQITSQRENKVTLLEGNTREVAMQDSKVSMTSKKRDKSQDIREFGVRVLHLFEKLDSLKHLLEMQFNDSYVKFKEHYISEREFYAHITMYREEFEDAFFLYLYRNFSAKTYTNLLEIMNKTYDDCIVAAEYVFYAYNTSDQRAFVIFWRDVIEKLEEAFKQYFRERFGMSFPPKPE